MGPTRRCRSLFRRKPNNPDRAEILAAASPQPPLHFSQLHLSLKHALTRRKTKKTENTTNHQMAKNSTPIQKLNIQACRA